jgi:hypothetical protein
LFSFSSADHNTATGIQDKVNQIEKEKNSAVKPHGSDRRRLSELSRLNFRLASAVDADYFMMDSSGGLFVVFGEMDCGSDERLMTSPLCWFEFTQNIKTLLTDKLALWK